MELVEKLLAYYKENEEDFVNDIEELDNWNGCLYEDRVISMNEIDVFFQNTDTLEILRRAFYGYDDDFSTSSQKAAFNPNRDYFYFNAYGNLVSTDEVDYSEYLDEYFIQEIIDNRCHLSLSEGSQEIIDDYEAKE